MLEEQKRRRPRWPKGKCLSRSLTRRVRLILRVGTLTVNSGEPREGEKVELNGKGKRLGTNCLCVGNLCTGGVWGGGCLLSLLVEEGNVWLLCTRIIQGV